MRRSLPTYQIGRSPQADIVLADATVSRRHAELVRARDGTWFLTDCGSTGGTFIWNAGKWDTIRQSFVSHGDRLRFGEYECGVDDLLHRIPQGGEGAIESLEEGSGAGSPILDDRPQGPVRRDPATGEVIPMEDK